MRGFVASFALATGLSYGGLSLIGQDKIMKMFMAKSLNVQPTELNADWKKKLSEYSDFTHPWKHYLTESKIQHIPQDSTTSYIYFPKGDSQGFPGVCHGGFSYSVCLSVAKAHAKEFNLAWPPKHSKMTYLAPIRTEEFYQIKVSHQASKEPSGPKVIKAQVLDAKDKVLSVFTSILE